MKRKNAGITILVLIVIAAGALFANRVVGARQVAQTQRFAPLALNSDTSSSPASDTTGNKGSDSEVVNEIKHDVSARLSDIAPLTAEHEATDADMDKLFILPGRGSTLNPNAPVQPDGALQTDALAPNAPAPLVNFDGITNLSGVLPPDTNGDVGPNHYMQWVNLSFAIYSKTGALLYGPAAGNTLWSGFGGVCQTRNDGDPIVQYDHLADRWMVSQFAVPGGTSGYHQCIAVSQTGDPTGAWYRYDFLWSSTNMNDYPHFGVWPDGYYMTVHEFANGATWAGQGVAVFERSQMLQGLPARMVKFNLYSTDPNMGGMLPSDLDGPAPAAGTPNYFVEPDDNAGGFPQDQVQIWAFHVDWANTANSTFTRAATLATAAFDSNMCNGARACIPQQGTTAKLDAIADRAMYRAQYRNFGGYQTIVMNHTVDATGSDRAGVRWYELRNTGGAGWVINQQSTFSPDSTQRWMGSIAMNSNGDIALGYSASSSTMYPAVRYTGRLATDPLNSMTQGEGTLIAGTGAQTHTAARWGDYSMLAVDPSDDCTFWYTNEYVQTTGSAPWRTRIGSFKLANCGAPAPTPTSTNTAVPPTSTPTFTPTSTQGPTFTNTPVPPTFTPTFTPTSTNTPLPPTNTPTSTQGPTFTNTPVPPSPTNTNTPLPPTNTPTATSTPLPATFTPTPSPTATAGACPNVSAGYCRTDTETRAWIAGTTNTGLTGDDQVVTVNLPFAFTFFGTNYTSLKISSNGNTHFGTSSSAYANVRIPSTSLPNAMIAGFWDDLYLPGGGSVLTTVTGTAPNRVYTVEWRAIRHYGVGTKGATFEIQLTETTNQIWLIYQDPTFGSSTVDNGLSATSGIENAAGNAGNQYSFNQAVLTPGKVIHFWLP